MFQTHSFSFYLADACWKATLLLLATAVLARILRGRPAATRHLLWSVSLASLILLPLAASLGPGLDVPAPAAILTSWASTTIRGGQASRTDWTKWLPAVWAFGAAICLLRLLDGVIRSWWIARHAIAAHIAVESRVEIRESSSIQVPVITGLLSPTIILPSAARTWPFDRVRCAVRHELAHWRRQDCLTRLLAEVVQALYWFHPLVWYAVRRSRLESEMACDDAVLSSGARASDYAQHLVEVARRIRRGMGFEAAAAMVGPSGLEKRVKSILEWRPDRRGLGLGASVAIAAAAVVCVAALGVVQPRLLPVATAQDNSAAKDAQKHRIGEEGLTPPRLIFKVEPQYTQEAKDAAIQGTTLLAIDIDPEGKAQNITVQVSLDPGLDENAIQAVKQWRFQAAEKDGEPVWVSARVEVNFRLK